MSKAILVTGGAGFIGSHTCVELLAAGHEVVIFDNFSNSRRSVADRIARVAGRRATLVEGDVRDRAGLKRLFSANKIDAVIHFAGFKAVGESVEKPLLYYDNNVGGSLCLFEAMAAAGVRQLVFSSSATVYAEGGTPPYREDAPLGASNPYGRSKLMVEGILGDLARTTPDGMPWRIVLLRYFNPVGAHASGLIGEDPNGIPNNLLPYVCQVAVGRLAQLSVWGNDYATPDGTGVRDYIHVVDLALGHLAALRAMQAAPALSIFNLGSGHGHSVLQVVTAFERASGKKVPYKIASRRAGDVAVNFADPSRALSGLGWRTQRSLDDMCRDAWRWQQWQAAHAAEL